MSIYHGFFSMGVFRPHDGPRILNKIRIKKSQDILHIIKNQIRRLKGAHCGAVNKIRLLRSTACVIADVFLYSNNQSSDLIQINLPLFHIIDAY